MEARQVETPLSIFIWQRLLLPHPHQELVQMFLYGLKYGFRIGYSYEGSQLSSAIKNMQSALEHPEVVDSYLAEELGSNRLVGPFSRKLIPKAHISRFGVIPKAHSGKWRLILDLSHPKHKSVNDGIPKNLCSLSYVTIDDAVRKIIEMGPGTELAKIDVKGAFRLIPVSPLDRHLLAMEWKGGIFIDTCLPFGLHSAPKLFNLMADFLEWILYQQGVTFLLHYLDDYLTLGHPGTRECYNNLQCILATCKMLGVPLALEKVEGPVTSLKFLGIVIDTARMEARLPTDKLEKIRCLVAEWLPKTNATKRNILSLVGLLQHAAKVVRPGRIFVRYMYNVAARVQELDYYTRLDKEFKTDLCWWHTFLGEWNGVSLLQMADYPLPPQYTIQTDASGTWGCGAYFQGRWLQWQWPQEWLPSTIMAKELVPIVLSCAVWGPLLNRKTVLFQCDNTGVVAAVQKGSAKEATVSYLLRVLWFFTAVFSINLRIEHISGRSNGAADALSRFNMQSFFGSNPQATPLPVPLPEPLLQLLSAASPDWTSPVFRRLFSTTINMV